jgi:acetyltransferase-like isoleucine patch superfamily enzyme
MMHTYKAKNPYLRIFLKWLANSLTPTRHDYLLWEKKCQMLRRAGIEIGTKVAIDRGFTCLTGQEEFIHIGDYATIGIGARFWNYDHIHIGRFCMFAADVTLVNGGHDVNTLKPFSGPLTIGNGCWIGNGARIIGPLVVGDNAIVAAGAVVVGDVPAGAVVAGVPARVIKIRDLAEKQWHLGNTWFSPYTFESVEDR